MKDVRAVLNPHVASSTDDFARRIHNGGPNRYSTFESTCFGFLKRDLEAFVLCRHGA